MQDTQAMLCATLQWYLDQGVTDVLLDTPLDRFTSIAPVEELGLKTLPQAHVPSDTHLLPQNKSAGNFSKKETLQEAEALAQSAQTLEELYEIIRNFEGIALKKTAMNMVFSDGNPAAGVMMIGDAPTAADDREGKAFQGESGALWDKVLASIGLGRDSVYLTNVLNWRPPGGRSPTSGEIETSLPFIRRHITLVKPRVIVLCGTVPAKALLGREESLSKLRSTWHAVEDNIPTLATYHPVYLLSSPAQKRAVWADMLALKARLLT